MTVIFNSRRIPRRSRRGDYLLGASSIFNLRGSTEREYVFAESEQAADAAALRNDWMALGGDMRSAMKQYRRRGNS